MPLLFIGDFLSEIFIGIMIVLDSIVYSLISSAYKIFMAIASARLLSSDVYYEIASRIYIVIGVLMLFVLSYAILKAIVDPDQATKGDLGPSMVKRVIIAVVGLAITPVLFNLLYQAQGLFLEQDVLGKVFFRIQNTESITVNGQTGNPDEQIKTIGGAVAATSIWQAFFHPAEGFNAADIVADSSELVGAAIGTAIACGLGIAAGVIGVVAGIFTFGVSTVLLGGAAVALCAGSISNNLEQAGDLNENYGGEISLELAYGMTAGGGSFNVYLAFLDNYIEDDEIEYMWGVSTLCGAFALYAFASFSIDMGVRAAKLAYYQIIAPVPLIMQVLPKYKDTFSKYIKNVVSTFLEVFIRISVVYIVVFVICHLQDLFSSFGSLWGNDSLNMAEKTLALAFLIIGLVIFAKSAPDLICQSLNIEKGSMKLGIGKKLADGGAYAAGGVAGAGLTSAVRNWRNTNKRPDGTDAGFRDKAMSAIAGMTSGAARAAFNQFGPGPGRKPAMTWGDMKNVSEKAAQGASDKRDARDARQADHLAAQNAYNESRDNYNTATEEYNNALQTGDQAIIAEAKQKMDKARTAMTEALARARATTVTGAFDDNLIKKIDAYTMGTVSTEAEDASIKFMGSLDGLKDKLRDKTAKLSYVQAAMDYEKELNARQVERFDQAAYQLALEDFRRQNPAASDAQLEAERNRLRQLYTKDEATYRQEVTELSNLRTAAKKAREAAQDKGIVDLAAKGDIGVMGILTPFFQENADYINKNLSERFKIDADGTEMTLRDLITQNFGSAAISGGFDPKEQFAAKTGFMIKESGMRMQSTDSQGNTVLVPMEVEYVVDNVTGSATRGQYVPVNSDGKKIQFVQQTDASGNVYYEQEVLQDQTAAPSSTTTKTYSQDSFFLEKVFNAIANGGSADSKTATSVAGDAGKNAKSQIINSKEYQDKVTRKRQAQEGKK